MAFRLAAILPLCLLAACAKSTVPAETALSQKASTLVQTDAGPVIGGVSENSAKTWLGIPYAKPPVGELRWRPTEAAEPWQMPVTALEHANWCPQLTNGLDGLFGMPKGELRGDEDCLYLDVYAPSGSSADSDLPVMFWIHGGSNIWGRAEQYDGSKLAESGQVVVVVVQYRLGPLGWFAHPALEDGIANFALLDLVQALQWTHNNIQKFGGNPDAVTLFGESAGANNVLGLLAMPKADGLYRAAIAQSGLPASAPLSLSRDGLDDRVTGAVPAARSFTNKESPKAEDLRSAPLDKIFAEYGSGLTPAVIRDGTTLPDMPLDDAVAQHQSGRGLPIIIGSNRDEAKYLLAFDPDMTKKALLLFPKAKDKAYYNALSYYMTGVWRTIGVTDFAKKLVEHDAGPIRTYRFDWDEEAKVGMSDLGQLIGAAHSMEIPFVFGHFERFLGKLDKRLFTKGNQEGRKAVSETMMSCWTEFAHNDAPGSVTGACPAWPAIEANGPRTTMIFDTPRDGGSRIETETLTISKLTTEMKADPALQNDNRACEMSQRLVQAFGLVRLEMESDLEGLCPADEL
ncbi:hypothetical protein HY29_01075 [Hyphomonas beringensis]|uniref:Carboxylic ester hydrolase n=1 Tax=Hyphomonas beringensis TaxID=1280946 RepID=A0A062UI03_9PROT|nr:carboxylesterase family protein [Hyphomonas beringensis]KCZ57348.1 hypothetical protein HY29_01075 [Hyphomonas beringensis]